MDRGAASAAKGRPTIKMTNVAPAVRPMRRPIGGVGVAVKSSTSRQSNRPPTAPTARARN
jgi:hypothetical protein